MSHSRAFAITFSLNHDLTSEELDEFIRLCSKAQYYAVSTEFDPNGRLHAHAGVLYMMARTAQNVERGTFLKGSKMKDFVIGQPFAIKIKIMKSQDWMVNYMQKDGKFHVSTMPENFEEVRPYFKDAMVIKEADNKYERWSRMYKANNYIMPATRSSVESFFRRQMYKEHTLKVQANCLRFREMVDNLTLYVNEDFSMKPFGYIPPKELAYYEERWYLKAQEDLMKKAPKILGPATFQAPDDFIPNP